MKKEANENTDARLAAAGAEHLVLSQLMIRDIDAFKCERGRAGIDIIAVDLMCGTSVGIQVKSRYSSSATGFLIKEVASEFIIFVRLNRDRLNEEKSALAPDCYVFPRAVIRKAHERGVMPKVHLRKIREVERYREAWFLISDALKQRTRRRARMVRP